MDVRHADIITQQIEERIFNGRYQDGDRLDEVKLAEQFQVSRTPIREALQRLARSGLIQLVPRRGAFVRQPGPVELIEMFEVMAEFEAICGRLAATRISDEALADLFAANENCQAAVDAGDPDASFLILLPCELGRNTKRMAPAC